MNHTFQKNIIVHHSYRSYLHIHNSWTNTHGGRFIASMNQSRFRLNRERDPRECPRISYFRAPAEYISVSARNNWDDKAVPVPGRPIHARQRPRRGPMCIVYHPRTMAILTLDGVQFPIVPESRCILKLHYRAQRV